MIPAPQPETYVESPMPSSALPSSSVPPNPSASGDPPPSVRQRTVAREVKRKRGKPSKPRADRRAGLLRRYSVTAEALADAPQITPLLRQNGVKLARFVEVLRCDSEPESLAFIQFWDGLSQDARAVLGLEAIALAAQLTPRRLWELYHGATLMQAKESVAVMMAEALPAIMRRALSRAKTVKGDRDRERILKAARILPTPKGSTTVIYPAGLPEVREDEPETVAAGDLESADDYFMRVAKTVHAKSLPAATLDADIVEDEEDDRA